VEWVVLGCVAVAVVVVTTLVVRGRIDPDPMSPPTSSVPPLELPERLTSEDVDAIRVGTTAWGYAPREVDAALDARRDRLAEQERALASRTGRPGDQDDTTGGSDVHRHP